MSVEFEAWMSKYKTKLLKSEWPIFNLSKKGLVAFVESKDFVLWCELLYGDKDFEDKFGNPTVPYKHPGVKNPKLKGTQIAGFDEFQEFIEFKFSDSQLK